MRRSCSCATRAKNKGSWAPGSTRRKPSPRRSRSRRCSTTISSATTRAATALSTAPAFASIRKDRKTRRRDHSRVNAAAMATLALAPPPPIVTSDRGQPLITRAPSGYDANLRWNPSPGAAGYRVFWREAWGPDWQHEMLVGNVTNVVLPNTQIDDYVFGVAAVDAAGHESFIS